MGSDSADSEARATAEVDRQSIACLADGVDALPDGPREAARTTFTTREVTEPTDDTWSSIEPLLAVIDDVATTVGRDAVRELGRQYARRVVAPADAASVPEVLAALDERYREHHRGDAGGYSFRRIGDADGRVECDTLYPCLFDQGIVRGVATAEADGFVHLSEVGTCRDDGGARCTYELRW